MIIILKIIPTRGGSRTAATSKMEHFVIIAKLKFLNWNFKIERIADLKIANEHNFITFTNFLMDFNLFWYKIT